MKTYPPSRSADALNDTWPIGTESSSLGFGSRIYEGVSLPGHRVAVIGEPDRG